MIQKFQLNRIIVFLLTSGLFVFALEVYLQHWSRLEERPIMWTPIVFGVVGGCVGVMVFILFNRITFYVFNLLMVGAIVVGSIGLFFHNEWRVPLLLKTILAKQPISIEFLTTNPPLLAPSAFVAIGVLGLIIAMYLPWGKEQ